MTDLFRDEVFAARRTAAFGRVTLRPPLSHSLWCVAAALLAAALAALLVFGQYTRRVRIQGVTVPSAGIVRLTAPQPGIVLERRAEEGQRVRSGDVLFVIGSERVGAGSHHRGGVHAAVLEQLRRRRALLEDDLARHARQLERVTDALARRREALEREALQLRDELATHAAREASAGEHVRRYAELARQGFVSPAAARQRDDELLEQRARRQATQRALLAVRREVAGVAAELAQVPFQGAQRRAEVQRELALLQQEVVATEVARSVAVTAPQDGVLTAIAAEPGQAVAAPQPLATLLPVDGPMEAHLFAPSRAIGFVEAGQRVRVRFAAYPFQKFGQYEGEVVGVARAALAAVELPAPLVSHAPAEPLYRVTVRLASPHVLVNGHAQPLVAGMQVEADVMQERRRLIEWVFEPLIAVGRRA